MIKYDLPSGAVLDITLLPYGEAWDIAAAVIKEVQSIDIKLSGDVDFSNEEAMKKFFLDNVNDFKGPICAILSSKKVLESAHSCFRKCTYNNQKINGQTFESKEGRKDFLYACFYALKENIYPFLEGLLSSLSAS